MGVIYLLQSFVGIDDGSGKVKEHSEYLGKDSHLMIVATGGLNYNHLIVL